MYCGSEKLDAKARLMDVAYKMSWQQVEPLPLGYKIVAPVGAKWTDANAKTAVQAAGRSAATETSLVVKIVRSRRRDRSISVAKKTKSRNRPTKRNGRRVADQVVAKKTSLVLPTKLTNGVELLVRAAQLASSQRHCAAAAGATATPPTPPSSGVDDADLQTPDLPDDSGQSSFSSDCDVNNWRQTADVVVETPPADDTMALDLSVKSSRSAAQPLPDGRKSASVWRRVSQIRAPPATCRDNDAVRSLLTLSQTATMVAASNQSNNQSNRVQFLAAMRHFAAVAAAAAATSASAAAAPAPASTSSATTSSSCTTSSTSSATSAPSAPASAHSSGRSNTKSHTKSVSYKLIRPNPY